VEGIERDRFGSTRAGEPITRHTLTNRRGSRARLIDWGATLTDLWVPDRSGALGDVVLGFDTLEEYEQSECYFGCTIGRVANRIAGARFSLDGCEYALAANDGPHHLHGGRVGFDKAVWRGSELESERGPAVRFTHTSPDGDEGYPGTLRVRVTYLLDHQDALHIEYRAETDAPTPVNLTHHGYWNLSGSGDVLDHELTLHADRYTEAGPDLVPTGRILPVAGSPFDFRRAKPIGREIAELELGYDHNYVLADEAGRAAAPAGVLDDPTSGRRMEVSTSEPGLQLYTGNFLDGVAGKRGAVHERHGALCLEAQHYPDALHQQSFPPIVLRPGESYRQLTVYRFDPAPR
jgi:aldose 1-epimerase